MKTNAKIVLVGGGGGVYRIARYLKHYPYQITTIQTMFDHGGHSGKLRDERGVLPPGDIRQAILALADDSIEDALRALMSHRFSKMGSSIDDATVGNILLTALTEIYGDPVVAIEALCRIFRTKGKVMPVSLDHADLQVTLSDGSVLTGEGLIDTRPPADHRTIVSARLAPQAVIYSEAHRALVEADYIVFCPGDTYTSLIPNLLVTGFQDGIEKGHARLVQVVNLMTKKSETAGFAASDFVRLVIKHLGVPKLDTVICNEQTIPSETLDRYRAEEAFPVSVDTDQLAKLTNRVIVDDLIENGSVLRHSAKVASIIAGL